MQAAENGIRKVMKHPKALRGLKDVEALELGKETTAKVAEIVETGELGRNKAIQADAVAQIVLKVTISLPDTFQQNLQMPVNCESAPPMRIPCCTSNRQ